MGIRTDKKRLYSIQTRNQRGRPGGQRVF